MIKSFILLVFLYFILCYGKPVKHKTKTIASRSKAKAPIVQTTGDALKFFDKFGYNKCGDGQGKQISDGPVCQSSFQSMLEHFQTVFRLPVTGKLDSATINLMNTPRCSLGDYPMGYVAFQPW